MRDKEDG